MRITYYALAVLVVTAALFAPAIGYGVVYEDRRDAHIVLDGDRVWDEIRAVPFRALPRLSRVLEMSVFGVQPWAAHLGSLVWHLVNVTLLLALAWQVLPPWGAVAAAGVFAWHPVQVEAVVYVSARADLLATTGVLLALLATAAGSGAGALVGVAVACLSKESALVAWGLVPLWAAWTQVPFAWGRWLLIGGTGAALTVFWLWERVRDWSIVISPELIGQQLAVVWRLLALIVVPWGFTIDHDWGALVGLGPPALIVSLGVTCWALLDGWPRRSWLALAWLWTLVAVSPRLVVPLYEGFHERHLMVSMIGWSLCAGHLLTVSMRGGSALWRAEPTT